jgi:beta-glucosidase
LKLTGRDSIAAIITEMTLAEKLRLLTGGSMFHTAAMEAYGIPSACLLDGATGFNCKQKSLDTAIWAGLHVNGQTIDPEAADSLMGSNDTSCFSIRDADSVALPPDKLPLYEAYQALAKEHLPDKNTIGCFPSGMLLGATWNPEAVSACGEAAAREACAFGVDVLLGPNIDIHRDPRGGRLFEGYSEDPCLVSKLAPAFIQGVQSTGVAACVKHFAANNQETDRMTLNEIIPERALRELYLPGFRACVQEGGVRAVMSAYNKINGTSCSQHPWLLQKVLRDEWGFGGLVVSDWGGVYDRVESLKNGNDLTMPGPRMIGMLTEAVQAGTLPIETVDASVRRFLALLLELPVTKGRKYTEVDVDYSYHAAYHAAIEGITLLKNDGILPLSKESKVCFFGERSKNMTACGGGSAFVATNRITHLYDGTVTKLGADKVSFGTVADDTDVVIVTVGGNGREAADRPDMKMEPTDAIILREALAAAKRAGKPAVLLLNTAAPVELMDYIDEVSAVLCLYLPGMAGGQAAADILFGDAEPAGRLPLSWPSYYRDCPTALNFPGENNEVHYGEGLYVGYRYYDAKDVKPLFPFGHGLSYTRFAIGDLTVQGLTVSVTVGNIGGRPGSEVVQVYIHDEESTLQKPYKVLKAFQKVRLLPGERKTVAFPLTHDDFASYDPKHGQWIAEPGIYRILVGTSSEDILLEQAIHIRGDNPYSLTLDTPIGTLAADSTAMKILYQFIPGMGVQEILGTISVFFGKTKFIDAWPRFAHYFRSETERAAALEGIQRAFAGTQ